MTHTDFQQKIITEVLKQFSVESSGNIEQDLQVLEITLESLKLTDPEKYLSVLKEIKSGLNQYQEIASIFQQEIENAKETK